MRETDWKFGLRELACFCAAFQRALLESVGSMQIARYLWRSW